jgi:hypothetical protein
MRFRWPERWMRFIEEETLPGTWARALLVQPLPLRRTRSAAQHVERMLAEAPHPDWVVVPLDQFYGVAN